MPSKWHLSCSPNHMRSGFFFGMVLFASWLSAAPVTVDLAFQVQPGSGGTLTGRLSGSPSSSESTTYSGYANATVRFDPDTLQPLTIAFTDGRIFVEDFDFNISGFAFVPGFGNFFVTVDVVSEGIEEYLFTPNPPGSVLADGSLIASQHQLITDRGRFIITARVPEADAQETIVTDFGESPEPSTGESTTTLTIVEESADPLRRTLRFVLHSEELLYTSELIEDTTTSIILEGTETILAQAYSDVPTAYGQWVLDNAVDLSDGRESNAAGLPYALAYAFDLPPATGQLPIVFTAGTDNRPSVTIDLPVGGLRLPVSVQYSNTLEDASWAPLPDSLLSGGSALLEPGQTGSLIAEFPEGSAGFLRFVTNL